MRLYDETCLALCEGQFLDIRASESEEWMSVEYYLDMIGRKTAALIAGSVQAGAMLATDDDVGRRARTAASAGRWAWPSSSTTTCWASGATSRRPARSLRHRGAQEDAAAAPRAGARAPRPTASGCGRSCTDRRRRPRRSPRRGPSWSGPARASSRADARPHYRDEAIAQLEPLGHRRRRGDGAPPAHRGVGHRGLKARRRSHGAPASPSISRRRSRGLRRRPRTLHQDLAHAPAVGRLDGERAAHRRPAPRRRPWGRRRCGGR